MEIPQKQKFIAKQLMRASSVRNILRGKAMNGRLYKANAVDSAAPPTIREETISRIQIHIGDIMDRCNNNILERCWSWEVQEPIRNRSNSSSERPESRFSGFSSLSRSSSRIKEAGNFLLSKLQSKDPSSMLARGESLYEVMEAGTLGMQLFYVDGLESAEEASKVPLKIQNAYTWLTRKNWVNTDWLSGFLSQQGGDVSSWRRRFFKMVGSQLDAYHEFVSVQYQILFALKPHRIWNTEQLLI
jgi:hypothetical protein